MRPVVLTVAGSDSSGGAGIQADVATVVRLGGHPATVVTAVTAQSTAGVFAIHVVPEDVVAAQLDAVLGDLPVAAVKTGMLASAGHVRAVARALAGRDLPLLVDPVLVATSGDRLAGEDVMRGVHDELLPLATLVTPNADEAEAYLGEVVRDASAMAHAARLLVGAGARAALVTGGHLADRALDVLVVGDRTWELESSRVVGPPIHGTGCTLSAAIATRLAHGETVLNAARDAKAWVTSGIEAADALGSGARILGAPTRRAAVTVRERSTPQTS